VGTDPHSQHSRTAGALAGLLLATAVLAASGCASAWPLAGQFDVPPGNTAAAVSVTDAPARVRANAGGDLVPIDAPVAGTARVDDAATARTLPGLSVSESPMAKPERRRPAGFDPAFRRLEAALDDSDAGPPPPPPPKPRTILPAKIPQRVVSQPIRPAGGSGILIPPSARSVSGFSAEAASPVSGPSEGPRILEPATATAAVVQLPDVTDWSGTVNPTNGLTVAAGSTSVSGSSEMARRHVPWWIIAIGMFAMGGLIGLSRRLGWPSISPLE